ncbi:MAG: hypothetical protein K2Y27_19845 [Xanthobacteraceae bacterium]|nr:hypothetical protein [Xanthobacteraceae bacterium]
MSIRFAGREAIETAIPTGPVDKSGDELEHDPEKACPGLDPGCEAVFGKDHAQTGV